MSQAATQRRGGGGSGAVLSLDWYRSLSKQGTYAFWASSMGWALDAFDYMVLSFSLVAISATLSLSGGQGGFLATATLVVSAIGGVLAGMLADRIGRARTLMITIAVYSLFTFLAGLSQSYEQLLACRALQGLGFGGEWAVGAILVSELADPEQRGRLLGAVQSSWAVGWGLCAIAYTVIFSLVSEDLAWRVLFCLGIVPGLLVLYIRRFVKEPPVFEETQRAKKEGRVEGRTEANPLTQIFRRDLLGTTAAASLLAIGAQGGYYAIFTWLPTFLSTERGLEVINTGGYLSVVIIGSFCGYLTAGYTHDWIGRRKAFALFSVMSAVLIVAYTRIPENANSLLLVLGFPLGFFASGIFSGFGSYLSEIFRPARAAPGRGSPTTSAARWERSSRRSSVSCRRASGLEERSASEPLPMGSASSP